MFLFSHLLYYCRSPFYIICNLTGNVCLHLFCVVSFRFGLFGQYCLKMSSHQANTNKPRSLKGRHFCLPFDLYNYFPSCREAGKGDDSCFYIEKPCNICGSFTDEQLLKIKKTDACMFGSRRQPTIDVEVFSGSHADLEDTAEQLYSSPPRPQPFHFETLSIKSPQTVPHTPGSVLQNTIESKLEKSLGACFNIQQQMGVFQASMLEATLSLRDDFKTWMVDQISASDPKPGTTKQNDDLPSHPNTRLNIHASKHTDKPMETDFCWPALPPQFGQSVQSELGSDLNRLDQNSKHFEQ